MESAEATVKLPRVAITFCTQCRWMLRAAYFGQELLSTFGTQIGEVALIPATGGLFTVELTYARSGEEVEVKKVLLWDRKAAGGFPETKVLKQLVRDHIDPSKDLGHSDRHGKRKEEEPTKDNASKPEPKVLMQLVRDHIDPSKDLGHSDRHGKKKEEKPSRDNASNTEPMEVDDQSKTAEAADDGVKRNADGTICEDCR